MKSISAKQDDTSAISGRSMAQIAGPRSRQWTGGRKAKEKSEESSPVSFRARVANLAHGKVSPGKKKSTKRK